MKTRILYASKYTWTVTILALVSSIAISGSALAQDYVTGQEFLSNVTSGELETAPNALYADWNPSSGYPLTTINDATTGSNQGLEISSYGYGSLYYQVPVAEQAALKPADIEVALTFTINAPVGSYYVGVPFILDDNNGNSVTYGGYSTYGNGTWTETASLTPAMLADVQGGGEVITGFNLEFDPAGNLPNGLGPYDITFNSLEIEAVPEPASLALFGAGFIGLLAARRRNK